MYPSELTGDYVFDPVHSRFGFVARHAMVTKVRGDVPLKESALHLDAANPAASTVRVVLDVTGIRTGNDVRDGQLRGGDFLDVAAHPHIAFESTSVKHAGGDGFEVTGDLTIRGVTRRVTVSLDYTGLAVDAEGVTRLGFEGRATINRSDFGVTYNAVLEAGGVMISDRVALEFDLSAVAAA